MSPTRDTIGNGSRAWTRFSVLAALIAARTVTAAPTATETYDYVIAGAGTAGLVVANRLSENPRVTVAVVEPGPDVRDNADVTSVNFNFNNFNRTINFLYESVPQTALPGNKTMSYRAGKAIGGTSATNGMVYIRGDKVQYDVWESELGVYGWNWDSIFAYGKRGETFDVPTENQASVGGATYTPSAHGFAGPLNVGFPFTLSNGSSFVAKARETWASLGLESVNDLNGGSPASGFALVPMTVDRDAQEREDSARAYYRPVETRKNLKIIQGTVKKITWGRDAWNGEAVADGVEVVGVTGDIVRIGARKEVVLSASAYRNPLILESSGVGNPRYVWQNMNSLLNMEQSG